VKENKIAINRHISDLRSLAISTIFRGLTQKFMYVAWLKYKTTVHKHNSMFNLLNCLVSFFRDNFQLIITEDGVTNDIKIL